MKINEGTKFGTLKKPLFSFFDAITFLLWENRTDYYIDTSVLLENIPLVKFIKTTSGTRVVYFP